jgi:hypothetical protein
MSYKESGIKWGDVPENVMDIDWKCKNVDISFFKKITWRMQCDAYAKKFTWTVHAN